MSKVFHKDSVLEDPLPYSSALELLMGLADFERSKHSPGHSSFHLERINLLMRHLDEVHHRIPTIHIAGTKGKGSTSVFISSILKTEGYKTGLFTSPHIHKLTERIQIGSEEISKKKFSNSFYELWPLVQQYNEKHSDDQITLFEFLTILAFYIFDKEKTWLNL